jgi:hypothetical protein
VPLLGGLKGVDESAKIVAEEIHHLEMTQPGRRRFRLLAVSLANPDGNKLILPPAGVAYRDNPESHALWRWIAIEAPDLVLIAAHEDLGLAVALSQNAVADVGPIPAQRAPIKIDILQAARGGAIALLFAAQMASLRQGRASLTCGSGILGRIRQRRVSSAISPTTSSPFRKYINAGALPTMGPAAWTAYGFAFAAQFTVTVTGEDDSTGKFSKNRRPLSAT